ncbi:MAG: adenylyltransferase/cytidyltransferase family protein [Candidatus Latescibacteria bacterium]|nr:adenylyltransferase/cytidyltransferase family protein [Candidatus Latescibacterota bacterium]NIM20988.1 adenylyltransferase/cytidyltransferase family protein [Candidatus Latescibacterota bacterium]NIM65123.1 adenylyltransferase/cytidyltransferase family protein [Candidatus Latescibacterota bacterium]NIO01638.1 adenylyltransferase/cytidyltransferase family protein [Candidatus Latescibacterota bacterium]NIO28155.1 adenylyltransferase/cytidyltransferase family protein [Candidatus Latescibactero
MLISRTDLEKRSRAFRKAGKRIVFTNGCFDLVHPGHLHLIETAASFGDILLIAINDDASVRRLKGEGRPIYPASERAEILLALKWVDCVTVFSEDTPLETIRLVRPHVLVKGAEYKEEDIVGATFVSKDGGEVVRIRMKPGYSTRTLIQRVTGSCQPG